MGSLLRRVAAVALSSVALGAATSPKPTLPPFAHAYEPQGVDERGLWMEVDEDERKLRDSSFGIKDTALNAYIRGVLCRTVGEDRCAGARVYVMRVPAFNASMAPNGMVEVWSGLLLRMRNEAELSAVLGHEFAHFEQRHSLKGFKHKRSMSNIWAWASVMGGRTGMMVASGAAGSIYAFDRDQEREADMLGWKYGAVAGYEPHAAADVWSRLMDEADATALGRRQRSHRYDRVAFFADHPTNLERASTMRQLADTIGASGDTGEARYLAAIRPWRADFLADQLKLNDFGGTEYLLGQLAAHGWTEDLLFARGELYRMRGNPRDLVSAAAFYRQAIALDPAHAESHRGLGLAQLRGGEPEAGRVALKRYLELRPSASDAAMMSTLIS